MRRRGWLAIEIDAAHGFDLSEVPNQRFLRHALGQGFIKAVHFRMPSSSFCPGDAQNLQQKPALRSLDFLEGLPGLSAKKRDRVRGEGLLANSVVNLAAAALRAGIPGTIENPAASLFWSLPGVQRLHQHSQVYNVEFDLCVYGAAVKRSTRLLAWLVDLRGLGRSCAGTRNLCSQSGRRHLSMHERQQPPRNPTQGAEPYPKKLVEQWAHYAKNYQTAKEICKLFGYAC